MGVFLSYAGLVIASVIVLGIALLVFDAGLFKLNKRLKNAFLILPLILLGVFAVFTVDVQKYLALQIAGIILAAAVLFWLFTVVYTRMG